MTVRLGQTQLDILQGQHQLRGRAAAVCSVARECSAVALDWPWLVVLQWVILVIIRLIPVDLTAHSRQMRRGILTFCRQMWHHSRSRCSCTQPLNPAARLQVER